MKRFVYIGLVLLSIVAIAAPQDNKTQKKPAPKAQPVSAVDDEDIPDSLLHPRWKIQKIAPLLVEDLDSSALDLKMPDNIRQTVEYVAEPVSHWFEDRRHLSERTCDHDT